RVQRVNTGYTVVLAQHRRRGAVTKDSSCTRTAATVQVRDTRVERRGHQRGRGSRRHRQPPGGNLQRGQDSIATLRYLMAWYVVDPELVEDISGRGQALRALPEHLRMNVQIDAGA